MCAFSAGLYSEEWDAVESLFGRVPHRISVADTSGIHISVKTAAKYHEERLSLLLLTWLQTVEPHQVHIVTDDSSDDRWIATAEKYGFNVAMASGCLPGHCRACLCCKSGVEFEQYYSEMERGASSKWFCHVDDDVYINIPQLVDLLNSYHPLRDHLYLGRWSLNRDSKLELSASQIQNIPGLKSTQFAFGTGALYCISGPLMAELEPYLRLQGC
jgi:fringe protein